MTRATSMHTVKSAWKYAEGRESDADAFLRVEKVRKWRPSRPVSLGFQLSLLAGLCCLLAAAVVWVAADQGFRQRAGLVRTAFRAEAEASALARAVSASRRAQSAAERVFLTAETVVNVTSWPASSPSALEPPLRAAGGALARQGIGAASSTSAAVVQPGYQRGWNYAATLQSTGCTPSSHSVVPTRAALWDALDEPEVLEDMFQLCTVSSPLCAEPQDPPACVKRVEIASDFEVLAVVFSEGNPGGVVLQNSLASAWATVALGGDGAGAGAGYSSDPYRASRQETFRAALTDAAPAVHVGVPVYNAVVAAYAVPVAASVFAHGALSLVHTADVFLSSVSSALQASVDPSTSVVLILEPTTRFLIADSLGSAVSASDGRVLADAHCHPLAAAVATEAFAHTDSPGVLSGGVVQRVLAVACGGAEACACSGGGDALPAGAYAVSVRGWQVPHGSTRWVLAAAVFAALPAADEEVDRQLADAAPLAVSVCLLLMFAGVTFGVVYTVATRALAPLPLLAARMDSLEKEHSACSAEDTVDMETSGRRVSTCSSMNGPAFHRVPSGARSAAAELSRWPELRGLQHSLNKLTARVGDYLAYLPPALFANDPSGCKADGLHERSSSTCTPAQQRLQLGLRESGDVVVMRCGLKLGDVAASRRKTLHKALWLRRVVRLAQDWGGEVESLSGMDATVSFGLHGQSDGDLPFGNACEMALALRESVVHVGNIAIEKHNDVDASAEVAVFDGAGADPSNGGYGTFTCGIATGPVCYGNVGTSRSRHRCVVGAAVERAAVLHQLSGISGYDVLASGATCDAFGSYQFLQVDSLAIKGPGSPCVPVFQVVGRGSTSPVHQREAPSPSRRSSSGPPTSLVSEAWGAFDDGRVAEGLELLHKYCAANAYDKTVRKLLEAMSGFYAKFGDGHAPVTTVFHATSRRPQQAGPHRNPSRRESDATSPPHSPRTRHIAVRRGVRGSITSISASPHARAPLATPFLPFVTPQQQQLQIQQHQQESETQSPVTSACRSIDLCSESDGLHSLLSGLISEGCSSVAPVSRIADKMEEVTVVFLVLRWGRLPRASIVAGTEAGKREARFLSSCINSFSQSIHEQYGSVDTVSGEQCSARWVAKHDSSPNEAAMRRAVAAAAGLREFFAGGSGTAYGIGIACGTALQGMCGGASVATNCIVGDVIGKAEGLAGLAMGSGMRVVAESAFAAVDPPLSSSVCSWRRLIHEAILQQPSLPATHIDGIAQLYLGTVDRYYMDGIDSLAAKDYANAKSAFQNSLDVSYDAWSLQLHSAVSEALSLGHADIYMDLQRSGNCVLRVDPEPGCEPEGPAKKRMEKVSALALVSRKAAFNPAASVASAFRQAGSKRKSLLRVSACDESDGLSESGYGGGLADSTALGGGGPGSLRMRAASICRTEAADYQFFPSTLKACMQVLVILDSAQDLVIKDITASDPFVQFCCNDGVQTSSVVMGTLNPVWEGETEEGESYRGEMFLFPISLLGGGLPETVELRLSVFDYDIVGANDFMGRQVVVVPRPFFDGKLRPHCVELYDKPHSSSSPPYIGTVSLRVAIGDGQAIAHALTALPVLPRLSQQWMQKRELVQANLGIGRPVDQTIRAMGNRRKRRNWKKAAWSLLRVAILLFNCARIPTRVVFAKDGSDIDDWYSMFLLCMDYVCDVVYWVAMANAFRTPYAEQGQMVTDRSRIASHYIRGQFLFDVLSCFPWEFVYAISDPAMLVRKKWLRVNRCLYLVRFGSLFTEFGRDFGFRDQSIIAEIFILLLLLAYYLLWLGCFWGVFYFKIPGGESTTRYLFTTACGVIVRNWSDLDMFERVIQGFHWALRGFAGYGGPWPTTDLEHVASLVVGMTGVAVFATVIAYVQKLISILGSVSTTHFMKLEEITCVLSYMHLPLELSDEILEYYHRLYHQTKQAEQGQFDFLAKELPMDLYKELSFHVNKRIVALVPELRKLSNLSFITSIVSQMEEKFEAPGDILMARGDTEAHGVYFIYKGSAAALLDGREVEILGPGSYWGEVSVVYSAPQIATVEVLEYTELFYLPYEAASRLLNEVDAVEICNKGTARREAVRRMVLRNSLIQTGISQGSLAIRPTE